MDISKIPAGKNVPYDLNVIIEIPLRSDPVKYEVDKDSGAMFVDRFLHTAMFYPANYGFVPHTISDDGDPVDVVVIGRVPVVPGAVMRSRPIGALVMEDEAGMDEKIIAVPVDDLHPFYSDVHSYRQLPQVLLDQIAHFFTHYKDLEEGKWARIVRWADAREAEELIIEGYNNAKSKKKAKEITKKSKELKAIKKGKAAPHPAPDGVRQVHKADGASVGASGSILAPAKTADPAVASPAKKAPARKTTARKAPARKSAAKK